MTFTVAPYHIWGSSDIELYWMVLWKIMYDMLIFFFLPLFFLARGILRAEITLLFYRGWDLANVRWGV